VAVAVAGVPISQDLVNAFDLDSKSGEAPVRPCGHALNAGPINCGQNALSLIPATSARVEMAFQSSSSYLWLGTYLSTFLLTLPR
jgi:hypothetical protein